MGVGTGRRGDVGAGELAGVEPDVFLTGQVEGDLFVALGASLDQGDVAVGEQHEIGPTPVA